MHQIIGGWTALFCGTVCYDVQGVSADEALRCYLLSKQYFLVVLFIVLYKVVLAFELADDILKCYYSNESYCAVLPNGAVTMPFLTGSNF